MSGVSRAPLYGRTVAFFDGLASSAAGPSRALAEFEAEIAARRARALAHACDGAALLAQQVATSAATLEAALPAFVERWA